MSKSNKFMSTYLQIIKSNKSTNKHIINESVDNNKQYAIVSYNDGTFSISLTTGKQINFILNNYPDYFQDGIYDAGISTNYIELPFEDLTSLSEQELVDELYLEV